MPEHAFTEHASQQCYRACIYRACYRGTLCSSMHAVLVFSLPRKIEHGVFVLLCMDPPHPSPPGLVFQSMFDHFTLFMIPCLSSGFLYSHASLAMRACPSSFATSVSSAATATEHDNAASSAAEKTDPDATLTATEHDAAVDGLVTFLTLAGQDFAPRWPEAAIEEAVTQVLVEWKDFFDDTALFSHSYLLALIP